MPELPEEAPELETPEHKRSVPPDALPEQAPDLETTERKPRSVTDETRDFGHNRTEERPEASEEEEEERTEAKPRSAAKRTTRRKMASKSAQAAESATAETEFDDGGELAELARHVSAHPVDAHAPVWTPRAPNVEGGYQ